MFERDGSSGSATGYAAFFIAGIAIGTLATGGLLMYMAPTSGKRIRRELTKKSMDLRDQASDRVDDLKDNASDWIARGRSQSKRLAKQAKGVRNDVKGTVGNWQKYGRRQVNRQAGATRGFAGAGRRLVNRVLG